VFDPCFIPQKVYKDMAIRGFAILATFKPYTIFYLAAYGFLGVPSQRLKDRQAYIAGRQEYGFGHGHCLSSKKPPGIAPGGTFTKEETT
jgi:hypothetical protein